MTLERSRRPNIFLSRARAYWRLARKAQKEGNKHLYDWYSYQAQIAYTRYHKMARP